MPDDTFAPDSDIDLLIDPDHLAAAVIRAQGYQFVRLPGLHFGVHLIAYDADTGSWLWLHCVTELRFGPYQALRSEPARHLLARRLSSSPARLSPNDEFWVTLAHCFLDRRRIVAKHRRRLSILAGQSSVDSTIARDLEALLPGRISSQKLLDSSRLEEWALLEQLIPKLIEAATRRARPGLTKRAVRFTKTLLSRPRELRLRRGISVALLGPDGAGKSTLAAEIERTFVFPVRQVYMGLTGGMLRQVDRLRIPGVVRAGRLAVIWWRYLIAQYQVTRGRLVVFDRYIYDAEVPTPHPLSVVARIGRWIDGHCCPAPDLILLLDAPGAVMHQRKPSYTAEMVENWRQHFRGLQRRLPRMEVLDTTRTVDEVLRQATYLVWREYARRWGGRDQPANRST